MRIFRAPPPRRGRPRRAPRATRAPRSARATSRSRRAARRRCARRSARIERAIGVLEDHLEMRARRLQLGARQREQRAPLEPHLARGRLRQRHHRARERRLARAGFADDAERAPRLDGEADAVDRAAQRPRREPVRAARARKVLSRSTTSSSGALMSSRPSASTRTQRDEMAARAARPAAGRRGRQARAQRAARRERAAARPPRRGAAPGIAASRSPRGAPSRGRAASSARV